ncbi:MAG: phenylalanine--tRNA ligase subunit beta [Eubacteriales bacterium]|nr:phenylalanine--tRNA ligase subunit beta [Eubacteriales bacterium]
MKVSLNWIRDYIDLPADLEISQLAYDLTMRTVEVEGVESTHELLDGIVIGKIISVDKHPDADLLRVVLTDVGQDEPLEIVCGGSNLEPGQLVAVAVPGSMVRWHGEGDPVEIKPAKLRGVMSYGMICGANELGLEELFPVDDESIILDLSELDAKAGTPLADALDMEDYILEIDNKSMTNRPDLWGHYGIARELAAIYGLELKPFEDFEVPDNVDKYSVEIESPEHCRRYVAAVYEGVENRPSPFWMQQRLWSVGQRPINLLVDISNYVMMATGQPTHGFDASHVKDGIIVRHARKGETLELLDKKDLELTKEDLVICDHRGPLALAGVMGGARDSILPETDCLVLELANFQAQQIRRTAARYDHRTEASTRFEKAIDTQRIEQAAALSDKLIRELMPNAKLVAYQDTYPVKTETATIQVNRDFLERGLGRKIESDEIERLLSPLGFELEQSDEENIVVSVPSWRSTGDVSLSHDILEEVARMIGYENFDFVAPTVRLEKPVNQPNIKLDRSLREYLAHRCGFREIFTYPWIDDEYIKASGLKPEDHLQLSAPPAPTQSHLRSSLIPGLLEAVQRNLRYRDSFRIFELTEVFQPAAVQAEGSPELLPLQERSLGGALVAPDSSEPFELLRQARGVIETLSRYCHMENLSLRGVDSENSAERPAWADRSGWLEILDKQVNVIGSLGLVSLKTMSDVDIKRSLVALFEINVERLNAFTSRSNTFEPLPHYPLVEEDLSLLMDETVTWKSLQEIVLKQAGVKRVSFMEEYRGEQVPEDKKSVMLRFWMGSDEKTLTSEDIEMKIKAITKALHKATGAEIRQ